MEFDEHTSYIAFIVVAVTAPIIGVSYGGIVVQKCFGGYEHKNATYFVILHLILAASCTIPIHFINNLPLMSINVWFLLAIGGSCIPTIQGIVISTLPHKLRASGNSMCNLLIFICGFAAAPLFYGFVFDLTKERAPKFAFVFTLCWGWVSLIAFLFAARYRFRRFKDPNSQECKNIVIGEKEVIKENEINELAEIKEKQIDLHKVNFKNSINEA